MLIFLAEGRLGNQLFQYAFLKSIQKNNEKIIVSGFEELKEVFIINDIINLNKKNIRMKRFIYKKLNSFLNFLADKKIISFISVNHEKVLDKYRREKTSFTTKKGLFSFITFIKLGYFQSEKFFNKNIISQLKIKNKYINEAKKFLNNIPENYHKVFIHIRRGDYKNYTVYGKSTLLPISYYKDRIKWFEKNRENCFLIFLSDEPEFIEKEFGYIKNKMISKNNHYGTDFAIMTQCESAILSPSSFGWWGSYMMNNRDIVFAPKYWLGFRSKKNFGTNISNCPSFVKEIDIYD